MRVLSCAVLAGALMALAPMPAFAHHKPNHPDFTSRASAQATERARDPCNAVSNNPHESNARQAMQQRCRHLRAQLRERADDAALRAQCDRLARGLTGLPC